MTKLSDINDFLSLNNLAFYGISKNEKKFGNSIFKKLNENGYNLFPVHPDIETFDGKKCYKSVNDVPGTVDGIVLVIKPDQTEKVLADALKKGIKNIWFQQGSQSDQADEFCKNNNLKSITKECLFMFLEPEKFPHGFHKWIVNIFGKYPK